MYKTNKSQTWKLQTWLINAQSFEHNWARPKHNWLLWLVNKNNPRFTNKGSNSLKNIYMFQALFLHTSKSAQTIGLKKL